jgi:hypothetical protein
MANKLFRRNFFHDLFVSFINEDRMNSRLCNNLFIILFSILTGLLLFTNCSQTPQKADDKTKEVPVSRENTSTQPAEDVEKYWTEKRMREAKPMPFPKAVIPEESKEPKTDEKLPDANTQGHTPGQSPGGGQQSDPEN